MLRGVAPARLCHGPNNREGANVPPNPEEHRGDFWKDCRMARPFSVILGASVAVFVLDAAAFAFGLTDSDIDYLTTQNIPRDSSVLKGMSPKELSTLHFVINDERTGKDPAARAKNVADAVEEFHGHQRWEQAHPGQLWNSLNR
jgi:hypothetical protein